MTDFLALNYRSGDSSLSFGGDLNSLRAYFIVILHQYITSYRVIVMIVTCFGILPRIYAKTESYGTSLTRGKATRKARALFKSQHPSDIANQRQHFSQQKS
ncbi:hypothetical protein L6164_016988 [Bauhinia variegata]|uniref:Uncharacterized protein n=1 Tax=Bauhinia variegata TaxID=167791 RepID=A0ACB9N6N4_BAUVA|nr:hypothetical protein L6164_016988 [Bauhinia variegata]